jgi:plastocyanin
MTILKQKLLNLFVLSFVLLGVSASSVLAQTGEYVITIKEHVFLPAELEIPAGQKVKLVIENHDATAEEFESYDLRREKVVAGNGKIVVFVGPLKPGKYKFFGEFHPETAQGFIIVK